MIKSRIVRYLKNIVEAKKSNKKSEKNTKNY